MARILKLIAIVAILFAVLYFGGYTFKSLSKSIEVRNPEKVMSPLTKKLPEIKEDIKFTEGTMPEETINFSTLDTENDPSATIATDENGETIATSTFETDENGETVATSTLENTKEQGIGFEYTRILKINIGDKTLDLSSTTSAEFIKWLTLNYNSNITYIDENGNKVTPIVKSTIEAKVGKTEKTEATTTTSSKTTVNPALVAAKKTTKSTTKATTTKSSNTKVTYSEVLKNEEQLNALIKSIPVVAKLDAKKGYNRNEYEKPIKSFKLNGKNTNRNDYAWKTSKYFNSKNFTYTCPYTGKVIKDSDDKKNDKDFGTLDYDHLVPLASTYIRGGKNWTKAQKNTYAYDQWVAVDVLNSANRSKSDKGPLEYLPDKNVEDYCYSWLQICSKYKLNMTQKEIDLCKKHIVNALKKGEKVEHMCGKNP